MTELLFEKFEVPALFLSKNAVLASFAVGRATSLSFECGAGVTAAVPVYDGYVLPEGIVKSNFAGLRLSEELQASLEANSMCAV